MPTPLRRVSGGGCADSVPTAVYVAVLCGDNGTDRGTRMAAVTAAGYRVFAISPAYNQHIAWAHRIRAPLAARAGVSARMLHRCCHRHIR